MSIRYIYNVTLAVAAGFLVVASQVFTAGTAAWLTFAIATSVTIAAVATAVAKTGPIQRTLSAIEGVLGTWTIVASLVFAPTTASTLGFAGAVAFVALALAGLTAHELTTERIVHSLELGTRPASVSQVGTDHQPVAA